MIISQFLAAINTFPQAVVFTDFTALITAHYVFTPTAFVNGDVSNSTDENQGSCKVFSFAKMHGLTDAQTLACFGEHYRSVVATPDGEDHQNIRNFMKTGMAGVTIDGQALKAL